MARKIINIISTVLLVLLVLLVIFIFISRATGNSPSIFGYRLFRVSSGSMEPELSIGDVILDKKVTPEEIHKDDTITYKGDQGDFKGIMVTHKVIDEPYEENGVWYFQTQGIVSGSLKDPLITYDQVQGKMIKKLSYLNKIYTFFLSPAGLMTFILIIMVLFGYEMISLIISYRSFDDKDEDYYAPKAKKPNKKRKN